LLLESLKQRKKKELKKTAATTLKPDTQTTVLN
jgi:hypothetical protein